MTNDRGSFGGFQGFGGSHGPKGGFGGFQGFGNTGFDHNLASGYGVIGNGYGELEVTNEAEVGGEFENDEETESIEMT